MAICGPRWLVRFFAAAAVAALVFTAHAAHARCYSARQQLLAMQIVQFTTDPTRLLAKYAEGGPLMVSATRDLIASDPATLPAILNLVKDPRTSPSQINAIGTGLGQGALVCMPTDREFAAKISARRTSGK